MTRGVEIANLIIDRLVAAKKQVLILKRPPAGLDAGEEVAEHGLVGQIKEVGFNRVQLAADDVGMQIDHMQARLLVERAVVREVLIVKRQYHATW